MRHILLAVGLEAQSGEQEAKTLVDLAENSDELEVTVLHPFKQYQATDSGATVSSEEPDSNELTDSQTKAIGELEAAGLRVRTQQTYGDQAADILGIANERDTDLIIMKGRKRSPAGKAIFGSVIQSVLLQSSNPVLVIPDTGPDESAE